MAILIDDLPSERARSVFISGNENSELLSLVYHVFLMYQVTEEWLAELLLSRLCWAVCI